MVEVMITEVLESDQGLVWLHSHSFHKIQRLNGITSNATSKFTMLSILGLGEGLK